MYDKYRISFVIPCLNEELGISQLLPRVPAFIDEVIIIDNGSTDNTKQVASNLGAKVISEPSRGYGRAYKTGISAAMGDIVVTMDGDTSYLVEEIELLLKPIVRDNKDFISGCRFPLKDQSSMPRLNRVGNQWLTIGANLFFSKGLKDSQSGMWAFRKNIYTAIQPQSDGMAFSQEIKLGAILANFEFEEVPISYHPRIGEVKLNWFKDGIFNLVSLLRIFLKEKRK